MIVQIYEIQTPEQARQMIQLDVDHLGSVLLGTDQCQNTQLKKTIQMVRTAGRKSSLIPLFTDIDLISQALTYYQPDIVHFCETLPLDNDDTALAPILARQKTITERFEGISIMRSIPIGQNGHGDLAPSLKLAKAFEPISHWLLTDTLLAPKTPLLDDDQPVSGYVGITGITCDWEIARQLVKQSDIPVVLAGGIGPDNVTAAIAKIQPAGVDSCTQTNACDNTGQPIRFKKDQEKVRVMVRNTRAAT